MDRNNPDNFPGSGFPGQPPTASDSQTGEDQQQVRRPFNNNALPHDQYPELRNPPPVGVIRDTPHQNYSHGQSQVPQQAYNQGAMNSNNMSRPQMQHTNNQGMHPDSRHNQWRSQQASNQGAMNSNNMSRYAQPHMTRPTNNQGALHCQDTQAYRPGPQHTGAQADLGYGQPMTAPARAGLTQSSPAGQTQSSPGTEAKTSKGTEAKTSKDEKKDRSLEIQQQKGNRWIRNAPVINDPNSRSGLPWKGCEDNRLFRFYKEGAKVQEEMTHFMKRTENAISRRKSNLSQKPKGGGPSRWDKLGVIVAAEDKVNPGKQKAVKADLESYRARCAEIAAEKAARVAAGETAQEAADEAADQEDEDAAEDDEAADEDDEAAGEAS